MLGIIDDVSHITTQYFKDEDDAILLVGETTEELGGSEYLKVVHDKVRGDCPAIDMSLEKKTQDAVRALVTSGLVKSCHDVSEGGLAITLAECCITDRENQIGCEVSIETELRPDVMLFSESQSRFVIGVAEDDVQEIISQLGRNEIPVRKIGRVGGDRLVIDSLIDCTLEQLGEAYFSTLYRYMDS
jgi:phosphoribosylformylglycinamidine synthase